MDDNETDDLLISTPRMTAKQVKHFNEIYFESRDQLIRLQLLSLYCEHAL